MACRGIRGATTVEENTPEAVYIAAKELLREIISMNDLGHDDIASVMFSATSDIDSAYPAVAAREMGFNYTPLFCVQEMNVAGSLPKCLRVLLHVNTGKSQKEMVHVYQKGARILRPDLSGKA